MKVAPQTIHPLDHVFTYTEFTDKFGTVKREMRTTLRQLAKRIEQTSASQKDKLPLLKFAIFGDRRSMGHSLRNDDNVIEITGIELDFDEGDVLWDEAFGRLFEADLPALLYSSARYTIERQRFRVLLITSAPVRPEERERLTAWAYGVVKGTIDPASFGRSQSFYFGTARRVQDKPKGPYRDGVPVRVELVETPGRFIDQAHDLEAAALGSDGMPYRGGTNALQDVPTAATVPNESRLEELLRHAPGAIREDWLRVGMILHRLYDGAAEGFEIWDAWSYNKSVGNYDGTHQHKAWASFGTDPMRPQVGMGTLVRMAKENGWRPARNTAYGELRLLSTVECEAAAPPPYILKQVLAHGQIACFFGAPGAGKSLIGPYVTYKVALGEAAFGIKTKAGSVLYVAAEDSAGMKRRVAALAKRHGHTQNFQLVDGLADLFAEDSPDLVSLLEIAEAQQPTLIVIDTMAAAFQGLEENDPSSMGRAVAVARKLTLHGAAVILIHHDTKAEGGTPRGHGSLNGALDMSMHIKKDGGIVRGTLKKNRNGPLDLDIGFHIATENFGTDEDGDDITVAIAVELDGTGAARPPARTDAQRGALAVLDELASKDSFVSYDEWKSACIDGLRVSDAPMRKSRQVAFRRASTALIAANAVILDEFGVSRA